MKKLKDTLLKNMIIYIEIYNLFGNQLGLIWGTQKIYGDCKYKS